MSSYSGQRFPHNLALAYRQGKIVSRGEFFAHVSAVASSLPPCRYLVNLCNDRYMFMVTFFAAVGRSKINLLPPSRAPNIIAETIKSYSDSYCVSDGDYPSLGVPVHRINAIDLTNSNFIASPFDPLDIQETQLAAIVFTSGSTGRSKPNCKTWGSLLRGAQLLKKRFSIDQPMPCTIVATVPPQHMYGLETSVMLPVVSGVRIYSGRPFFPADVYDVLQNIPDPKILVTTPVHLRACVSASYGWPAPDLIISATAPMPVELALQVERQFNTPLMEIFGASEMGSVATRRSLDGASWEMLDTLSLQSIDGKVVVSGGHLQDSIEVRDRINIIDSTHFELLGRSEDMVNIAGKRASLAELNSRLLSITGIKDGMYFVPNQDANGAVVRPSAIIVATDITDDEILQSLRKTLDPVFLPRTILRVDKLPRNDIGKVSFDEVIQLVSQSTMYEKLR